MKSEHAQNVTWLGTLNIFYYTGALQRGSRLLSSLAVCTYSTQHLPFFVWIFVVFFKRDPSSFNFSLLGFSFDSILTFYIYFFCILINTPVTFTADCTCMYEAAQQCWHPSVNILLLNCMCSLQMLWITWCLLLFSIHKFILPNYTSHSCTVLTFSLCLSLCCLFLLLLQHTKDYATPFFCLWLRLRASASFRQTQNEVTHKVFALLLGLYVQRVYFFHFCFSFLFYFERIQYGKMAKKVILYDMSKKHISWRMFPVCLTKLFLNHTYWDFSPLKHNQM